MPSLAGRSVLAATLREHWDEALLYRSLARLRTADDGVDDPAGRPTSSLARRAADRWQAFCDDWGLARLGPRPHRWLDA